MGENEDEPMAMASTTKIMTCLVALENAELSDTVNISEYAASMPDVQLNAVAGDSFRLEDLLYALMLESDNDVAVAIAEHVGGSVEGFAAMMNARAEALGCIQTCFVTPNGLDAEGHCTTAAELAKIAAEAIKNETFVKIINTPSHSFSNIEGTRQYQVSNKDAFLQLMDGAFGVKTGFTGDAGYCFVGALNRDGRVFISVVLGSGWPPNKSYKWQDTMKIMNFGLENYEKSRLEQKILMSVR
ncbi:MAG: serine hydrolase [Frisingicoccus sp.]